MRYKVNNRNFFISGIIIYTFGVLFFLQFFYVKIDPDGTSYLRLVKYYAKGDWALAINAYWSPLIVWLLTPIQYLLDVNFVHYKLLLGIFGGVILYEFSKFRIYFNWSPFIFRLGFASLVILLWRYTMAHNSPDIISVYLLLRYLRLLWQWKDNQHYLVLQGLLIGFLGTLLYFSKSYNFAYFLVHFFAWQFWLYWQKNHNIKQLLTRAIPAFLVFTLISGIWIKALYDKYDKFTLSTSSAYNHALMSPQYQREHPMFFEGFLRPPHSQAIAAWEDPSFIEVATWSPFDSWGKLRYQVLHVTTQNLMNYFQQINPFWVITWLICLLRLLPFGSQTWDFRLIFWLCSIFIYSLGYSLILIEPRYTWLSDFLTLFLALEILSSLKQELFFQEKWRWRILVFFFTATLLALPLKNQFAYCLNGYPKYAARYELGQDAEFQKLVKDKRWASQNQVGCWHYTLALAYLSQGHYWGETKREAENSEVLESLRANQITFYFVWQNQEMHLEFPLIYEDKQSELRIYRVTANIGY